MYPSEILIFCISRSGISAASDMAAAAMQLRDDINKCRETLSVSATSGPNGVQLAGESNLFSFQSEFIKFAIDNRVLQFGSFKLKSGRLSPYFFNAGLFFSGLSMRDLSRFYAKAIKQAGFDFDVIFGPAYKGIPLATAVGIAWADLYGESKDVTYNRKEAKDHGEGGNLVGANMAGRRVLIGQFSIRAISTTLDLH